MYYVPASSNYVYYYIQYNFMVCRIIIENKNNIVRNPYDRRFDDKLIT